VEVSATPIVPVQRAPFASTRLNGHPFTRWIEAKRSFQDDVPSAGSNDGAGEAALHDLPLTAGYGVWLGCLGVATGALGAPDGHRPSIQVDMVPPQCHRLLGPGPGGKQQCDVACKRQGSQEVPNLVGAAGFEPVTPRL
jgi:hypothetical protein